jgi:hypothetical protein
MPRRAPARPIGIPLLVFIGVLGEGIGAWNAVTSKGALGVVLAIAFMLCFGAIITFRWRLDRKSAVNQAGIFMCLLIFNMSLWDRLSWILLPSRQNQDGQQRDDPAYD